MSTKIEVNAMGDACPLPVVKTLKALKQLDGEGAVVTSPTASWSLMPK